MKNFARKFFVADRIVNRCNTTRGGKKTFEFSFCLISRILCIFMKIFARKSIVGNLILNKRVPPGVGRNHGIQFLVNKSKSMHFCANFCQEIFCRKLDFEQMCHHWGLEESFCIQVLVKIFDFLAFFLHFGLTNDCGLRKIIAHMVLDVKFPTEFYPVVSKIHKIHRLLLFIVLLQC